jgi:hypothetical protein
MVPVSRVRLAPLDLLDVDAVPQDLPHRARPTARARSWDSPIAYRLVGQALADVPPDAERNQRVGPNSLFRMLMCERCGGKILARTPAEAGGDIAVWSCTPREARANDRYRWIPC